MTTKEIREKDVKALDHELIERQKHLFDLRSQAVTEKLEDPSQLRKTKKDIARIKTVLRQRALEASAEKGPETKSENSPAKTSKKGSTKTSKKRPAKTSAK